MSKPKVHIGLTVFDWIMELLGTVAIILMFGIVLFHFSDLPADIPTHFDAKGLPDKFGGKNSFRMKAPTSRFNI